MPHEKIARRCTFRGRVQGVGFRFFVVSEAESMGLTGWVRNLPDGSVEALLEGEEVRVRTVINRLREGPRWSRVDEVIEEPLLPSGKYSSFFIRG